jgi:hypothetical protein
MNRRSVKFLAAARGIGKINDDDDDPSSATRHTGRTDCNHSAMAGFAAAHGYARFAREGQSGARRCESTLCGVQANDAKIKSNGVKLTEGKQGITEERNLSWC